MSTRLLLITLSAVAPLVGQLPCQLRVDGADGGVRVAGSDAFAGSGSVVEARLAAGDWQLAFTPRADGRPVRLAVAAPAGGRVQVATSHADASAVTPTALTDGPFAGSRLFGDDNATDVRVRVRARARSSNGPFGLCCRWQDERANYRLLWDPARGEVRLERHLGNHVEVLGRTVAPPVDDSWHELELQAEGFRLQAFCDDVPVAQEFDGGLSRGRFGTFAAGDAVAEFDLLVAGPPVKPLPVTAVVQQGTTARVVARAPAEVNGVYALCLLIDRPTWLVPQTAAGFECFVLQRPALPLLLVGCSFGTVSPDGSISGSFAWPPGVALRGHVALASAMLGSPDASQSHGFLPWASVRF